MIKIKAGLRNKFEALVNRLSPENLSCDGECTVAQQRSRYNLILKEWRTLERQVGRVVTEDEIETEMFKRWSSK